MKTYFPNLKPIFCLFVTSWWCSLNKLGIKSEFSFWFESSSWIISLEDICCWSKSKVTDLGDFGLIVDFFKFEERLLIDEFGLLSLFNELIDDNELNEDGENKDARVDGEFELNCLIDDWSELFDSDKILKKFIFF
jgi:hypothetical protein